MSRKITKLISVKIERIIEEWAKIFESKEVDLRHSEFSINLLFRGFNKYDPKKVVCINEAQEIVIQKFVQENIECIKSHKVDFSTMEELTLI